MQHGGAASSTIFVRNLPYDVTDEQVRTRRQLLVAYWCAHTAPWQLAELFESVGPVRKSFVIKDKGENTVRRACSVPRSVLDSPAALLILRVQAPRQAVASALCSCTLFFATGALAIGV
jgi:hypothetical protein